MSPSGLVIALTKPLAKQKFLEHRSLLVRESAAWGGVRVDKPPISGSDGSTPGGVGRAGGTVRARVAPVLLSTKVWSGVSNTSRHD